MLLESPRYQYVNGEIEMAEITLQQMARANGKEEYASVKLDADVEVRPNQPSFVELFSSYYIWRTIPLFILFFTLSFGCGVFVWMPTLLQEKKFEVMSMYRSMVIMAFSQIPGVIMSAYVVEYAGRKIALMSFFLCGAASMVMFAYSTTQIPIITASIFMEFFLAGCNGAV